MSPFSVVEIANIVRHDDGEFDDCGPLLPIEKLDLRSPPKCLHGGIIAILTNGSRRSHDPQTCDILRERPGRDLRSVI